MASISAYHFLIRIIGCLFFIPIVIFAQPKADKATVLYGIFNNDSTLETQILPIHEANFNGGIRQGFNEFKVPIDLPGNASSMWYGSATLAADPGSGLFFYASKSLQSQSFWAVSTKGKPIKLSQGNKQLNGHCLTKMAMGPDGYVYALSTGLRTQDANGRTETLLIRFKGCGKPGCSRVEIMGYVPAGKNTGIQILIAVISPSVQMATCIFLELP